MPISDIVIDTNIFVHAENSTNCYCSSSCSVIDAVMSSDVLLCIDDVFDSVESGNTSRIGSEYYQHVRTGTKGYVLLLFLIANDRIKQVHKKNLSSKLKTFLSKSRIKAGDKVFLNVAHQSNDKTLISNDYADFNTETRTSLYESFDLNIVDSDEAIAHSVI